MTTLYLAAAAFLGLHLIVAGTPLRNVLTSAIGETVYRGLFALTSLGTLVWLAMAYNAAQASADNASLFSLGIGVRHLALPVVAIAFLLGIPGLLAPNPTSVGQEAAMTKPNVVRGVLHITRHPFLWGVAIWAAFHVAANGDKASTIFFGTFLVLALLGTLSIDAKRKRKLGPDWEAFAAKTSNVPFVAMLTGRTKFSLGEYFDMRFVAAAVVFAGLALAHARLFGVSPFPNGWVPF